MQATTLCHAIALALALAVTPSFAAEKKPAKPVAAAKKPSSAAKPAGKGKATAKAKPGKKPAAPTEAKAAREKVPDKPGPLADFGRTDPPDDVAHLANWISYTHNNYKRPFVLIDKKQARMYVFQANGKLRSHTPILLGKAIGDHTVPGVGNKPVSQVLEHEKTTPAGRFFAVPGKNTKGEGIIWIDYDAAVSMHRLRAVSDEERRAERMASPEPDDNRISYGCVNVPASFFDKVLRPAVGKRGAFVYVLPETKPVKLVFGSHDVPKA